MADFRGEVGERRECWWRRVEWVWPARVIRLVTRLWRVVREGVVVGTAIVLSLSTTLSFMSWLFVDAAAASASASAAAE